MKNNVIFRTIWEHVAIAFGLLCYAWGWQFFLNPHEVVGGAVTGLATVIMYGTRGLLPESIQGFFDMLGMASQGGGIPVSFTFFFDKWYFACDVDTHFWLAIQSSLNLWGNYAHNMALDSIP